MNSMNSNLPIDLYVHALDLAKEKEGLSNQDKMLLNRFKILLRSGVVENADCDRILREGKERADIAEEYMLDDLQHRGFIID